MFAEIAAAPSGQSTAGVTDGKEMQVRCSQSGGGTRAPMNLLTAVIAHEVNTTRYCMKSVPAVAKEL